MNLAAGTVMLGISAGHGGMLQTYRLYRLDGAGQIISAEWVDATDDEGARQHARQECGSIGYELWQRDRLVVRETARAD